MTRIARQMVGRWGMSDTIGKVFVLPRPEEEPALLPGAARASDETLELVDREVRRLVDECYDEALEQLRENRDRLDRLAQALLVHETLDEADAYRIAGIERKRAALPEEQPAEAATVAAARERSSYRPVVG